MKELSILRKIHKEYEKNLKYCSVPNKKMLICFAGIPGSGKTFIAKILEEHYKAVRIRSDDIREAIISLGQEYSELLIEKTREEYLKKYLIWLIENTPFRNKRIVLDNGIERKYDLIKSFADKYAYPMIIIAVECSIETATRRAHARNGQIDEHFNKNIDRWIKEHEQFTQKVKADIIIDNEKDSNFNQNLILEKLNALINEDK